MAQEKSLKLLKNLTVLYAEDDEVVLRAIGDTLGYLFGKVLLAKDGDEAIEIFKQKKPNIVILDNIMPSKNGLEAAKEIRALDKDVPIFFATNSKDTEDLLEAVKLNLVEYILKPLNYNKLESALLACLERLDTKDVSKTKIADNAEYCRHSNKVITNGQEILLTKSEICLIELLLKRRGAIVSNEEIDMSVFDGNMTPAAIRNQITRLRKKTGIRDLIKNVQNIGYKID